MSRVPSLLEVLGLSLPFLPFAIEQTRPGVSRNTVRRALKPQELIARAATGARQNAGAPRPADRLAWFCPEAMRWISEEA